MRAEPVAAVDCGTNSTRLLVADVHGHTLERLMRITRLGQGVDETGRLAVEAIDRTLGVLREYRAAMDRLGVRRVRMAATSAARDAANRDDFFDRARAVMGVEPELLVGDEEGSLSFAGATAELDAATGPWLVVDIGGGSTELAAGNMPGGRPRTVVSLDVGCVRVTERFLDGDPFTAAGVAAARGHLAALLDEMSRQRPGLGATSTLVGLAGTVACLAAVDQNLDFYDRSRVHHYNLTRDRVEEMLATLAGDSADERRRRSGVETGRADVIVGGAIVLAEVMAHFGFEKCLTSEADILDGMVMGLVRDD
jgi:exopolyphosphatase/guanosine-5'-triphosphate,3'-diphosphate pyrophosphatase